MEFFIKVGDDIEFDDISTNAEYMLKEELSYDKNTFIEHYFEDGIELIDFIDKKKLLTDDSVSITIIDTLLFGLSNKLFRLGI